MESMREPGARVAVVRSVIQRRAVGRYQRGKRRGQVKIEIISREIERRRLPAESITPVRRVWDWSARATVLPSSPSVIEDDGGLVGPVCPYDLDWQSMPECERRDLVASSEWSGLLDPGVWVLDLCGGQGWGRGARVQIHGQGMAARAARRMVQLRGAIPSDTSLEDAAAAAARDVWYEWACLVALLGGDDDRGLWVAHIRHLASVAWRAAYRSLTADGAGGRTGRKAAQSSCEISLAAASQAHTEGAASEIDLASLRAWAESGAGAACEPEPSGRGDDERRAARRSAVRWVARSLGVVVPHGWLAVGRLPERVGGRGGESRLRQVRCLAWLVLGASWERAARAGGFASVESAVESFRSGKVWGTLRASAAGFIPPSIRALDVERRRAARLARRAMGLPGARAGAGGNVPVSSVQVPSGAASVQFAPGLSEPTAASVGAYTVTSPAGARAFPVERMTGAGAGLDGVAGARITARADAWECARGAKRRYRAAVLARRAAWARVESGLRRGTGHKRATTPTL